MCCGRCPIHSAPGSKPCDCEHRSRWIELEQRGDAPLPRSSHSLTVVGGRAYCIGGENQPRVPIGSDMHVYDLQTGAWSTSEAAAGSPSPRVGHTAVAAGLDKIYVFGGRCGIDMGEGASSELFCFDTSTGTWSTAKVTGGKAPEARSYHAMAACGDAVYVFGGCGEGKRGRLADLHRFDSRTGVWRQLPSSESIMGRGGAGLVATADAVYVIAGFSGHERQDVWRHDLETGTWQELVPADPANALPARSVFSAAAIGKSLVVTGGEVDPAPAELGHAGAGGFSNDTFMLNTARASDGWQKLGVLGDVAPAPRGWFASSPVPVGAHGATMGILVHGGNSPSNERLGDMFMLSLSHHGH